MADPVAAPQAEPAAVVETPAVAAPVIETPVAAVPAEPAPAVEADAAPAAAEVLGEVKPHTETASLLEEIPGAGAAQAAKPEGEGGKPAEAAAPPEPAKPSYEAFTLPEGLLPDAGKMTAFTDLLGKHGGAQEFGQELVDLHTQAMQEYATHLATEQHRVFSDTRAQWRNDIQSDEMLGGARFETTKKAVARMRDMFVPDSDREGFNDFLRITGAGDHPAFWRLLRRAADRFDEPALPPPNPQPPPDIGRAGKGAGRRGTLYDHPSSSRGQQ